MTCLPNAKSVIADNFSQKTAKPASHWPAPIVVGFVGDVGDSGGFC